MDAQWVRNQLMNTMRQRNFTLESASADMLRQLPQFRDTIDAAVEMIMSEIREIHALESVPGVTKPASEQDLRETLWYNGPEDGDEIWPKLKARLLSSGMAPAVPSLDDASTQVVAHFAKPGVRGLKKRGLVLGYVQSGKTANFTASMAKAADAGYQLFIVLAGMHNNLRRQTQARIDRDLDVSSGRWIPLTNLDSDFGTQIDGAALMSHRSMRAVAVVKKNATRLRNLRDWLKAIPEDIRARTPILILDDEADQATPNTMAAKDRISGINRLVREIWAEVSNGTYVGYTATPFANIFMDPDDETDLYPADFIFDLPRSKDYFGAERVFGCESLAPDDEPDDGVQIVRAIPKEEASQLQPKSTDRESWRATMPPSLMSAVRWFLLATAIRRARGQADEHSSMLVHTTVYVSPHFEIQRRIAEYVQLLTDQLDDDGDVWLADFSREMPTALALSEFGEPEWTQVWRELPAVLDDVRVVVDNGASVDRLNYDRRDARGEPIPEVVIAVGGGTLSRGLTLEGLVVSYFLRTSSTYDTLLQMGRWFGFRKGYEDLPRIWMTADLQEDFRFLALVEEEIRRDMNRMAAMKVTPEQFGVRVRAHPGRLAITQQSKMVHAEKMRITYAGQRLQTIILHETNRALLEENLAAVRQLLSVAESTAENHGLKTPAKSQFLGVRQEAVEAFLRAYNFHPDQPSLKQDHLLGWLNTGDNRFPWNVVVLGSSTKRRDAQGNVVDFGSVDLGLGYDVPLIVRSPLKEPTSVANIKALMSQTDWLADLDPASFAGRIKDGVDHESFRRSRASASAAIILYPISPESRPLRPTQQKSRRAMNAPQPLIGVGLIFPEGQETSLALGGDYYTVRPDWKPLTDDYVEEVPVDTEGSLVVTKKEIEGMLHGR